MKWASPLIAGGSAGMIAALLGIAPHTPARRTQLPKTVAPVLAFPELGIDDTAAYQGYQTRFYRDSKNNTVQIYLQPNGGRVVSVWADAANESAGFTARDAAGRPARLTWAAEEAEVGDSGTTRSIEYRLTGDLSRVDLGWFVLGSMRVERDFVYAKRHLQPFTAPPFQVAEESLLVAAVARLPAQQRAEHLALLRADSLMELRSRLRPTITSRSSDTALVVMIERPSLDGRNRLALELRANPRRTKLVVTGATVSLRTRPGSAIEFAVKVATDAAPLTPLARNQLFNRAFLDFLSQKPVGAEAADLIHQRRLERQVLGLELLSSREKLMAGLPNFATYFGRDMMMTALMMRPIWVPAMSEHVLASVLRKLGPRGDVSHEEALGGQAIRENAVVYDSLAKAKLLDQAAQVLRELQQTRENYHMIDDEFQFPVLAERYLTDSAVPTEQKRDFLLQQSDSTSHLKLMLRELSLVTSLTAPYVRDPRPTTLVSFARRDSTHWRSSSWRDSDAGYAGGRFAMDINVIWAPKALESIASILRTLPTLGFGLQALDSLPETAGGELKRYLHDPASLRHAIQVWKGARRHFEVTLTPAEIRQRTGAKLSWLPAGERRYWQKSLSQPGSTTQPLTFLALSLDGKGQPIPVVNTDPSTELFLQDSLDRQAVLDDVTAFVRPYPVGLFVPRLGPLVANDAYASRAIWERFKADHYHGPRVVWGREVNLWFLGLAKQMAAERDTSNLQDALRLTLDAVNASGLQHNELWSYEIKDGRLKPVRYGTSSDVQLWNTTNLVVQYALSRLTEHSR